MSDEDNFIDAPQGSIVDRVKEAKKTRGNKKSSFTKRYNRFQYLVKAKSNASEIKESYDALVQAYEVLEKAHENYNLLIDEEEEGDYIGEPASQLNEAEAVYNRIRKECSQMLDEKGFEAAKTKVIVGMEAFERSCVVLAELGSDKSISFADMRAELAKIEAQYEKLSAERAEIESKFPSADVTELATKFSELVGEGLSKCKKIGLAYLQADVAADRTTSRSRDTSSTTKKETVMLPKFSGEEKTAYLKYPVWKKQWDAHIMDYEEKY